MCPKTGTWSSTGELQARTRTRVVAIKGEWIDLSGHRVFRLFEAEDEIHLAASVFNWTDLGVAEIIPVMETDKAIKFLKKLGKKS